MVLHHPLSLSLSKIDDVFGHTVQYWSGIDGRYSIKSS